MTTLHIPDHLDLAQVTAALAAGGYAIDSKRDPQGRHELVKARAAAPHCREPGCQRPPAVVIDSRHLCAEHGVVACRRGALL